MKHKKAAGIDGIPEIWKRGDKSRIHDIKECGKKDVLQRKGKKYYSTII